MIIAPKAVNEAARLAALHSMQVLDTPAEEVFDRITRLAAAIFDVPTALITLIDENRQWFKSRHGLDIQETPRDLAFCSHAILDPSELMVVPDATTDPRFHDNPYVTGPFGLRFYVGHPLVSVSDHCIGTLCLIDQRVRTFTDTQRAVLHDLAKTAQELLQFRELQVQSGKLLNAVRDESVRFKATFDQSVMGMAHVSPTGDWLRVNRRLCDMLGYTEKELSVLTFQDVTHPEDLEKDLDLLRQTIDGKIPGYTMEKRYFRKDGSEFWAELTVSLTRSPAGHPEFFVSVIDDISRRKEAEAALRTSRDNLQSEIELRTRELGQVNRNLQTQMKRLADTAAQRRRSEAQMRLVMDGIPGMVAYWDSEERCTYCNQRFARWLNAEPAQLVGRRMSDILPEAAYSWSRENVSRALAGEAQSFEREIVDPSGAKRHMQVSYLPDIHDGQTSGFFGISVDITTLKLAQIELQKANARLESESVTDALTGLRNRRYFNARGEEAFARLKRFGEKYGLLILDLDHFKRVNDQHGHDAGDLVLKALGTLLNKNLRAEIESAMRVGGEEVVVLFYGDVTVDSARQFGERLRKLIEVETIPLPGDIALKITASLGVALSNPDDPSWDEIYRRADGALYAAKSAGRNRVVVAEDSSVKTQVA